MSSMLQEAIVDARALRDSALRSAESIVIEKYSNDVRTTLEQILEQDALDAPLDLGAPAADAGDDTGMDPLAAAPMEEPLGIEAEEPTEDVFENEDDIPLAATDGVADLEGENLQGFPAAGKEVEVSLDLGALQEALTELQAEADDNQEIEVSDEILAEILAEEEPEEEPLEEESPGGTAAAQALAADEQEKTLSGEGGGDDDEESEEVDAQTMSEDATDALVDAIVEKLTVDMGADLSGWAGRSGYEVKWQMEKEMAHRRGTEAQEELEILKKAQEELVFENNRLTEQNTQYKDAINELREGLHDVNLSNARLLYTNRVLRNTSLNERQKNTIVEAISNAGSVIEAKTIFETLQSTAQASPRHAPQSLSEAITRGSSVLRASRQESTPSDPFTERMKRLAGIK
jgi:hypothetical protein